MNGNELIESHTLGISVEGAEGVENSLLRAMPTVERNRILEMARRRRIPAGEIICVPGKATKEVHFPLSGVLSALLTLKNGNAVEAAVIGSEGVAGASALINPYGAPTHIVQRMEGESYVIDLEDFRGVVAESDTVNVILGRYGLTLFHQFAQNVACNLHHRLEERMCRWLAASVDRSNNMELHVTQEFLSELLGVSRQSINATAGLLQQQGLISYSRGRLRVNNHDALKSNSCECYTSTLEAYDRLMNAA